MSVGSVPVETVPLQTAALGARLSVSVHADPAEIEAVWRTLETEALPAPFQRYDWMAAWIAHVAPTIGQTPLLVLGRIDGRPAFLWPLGVRRRGFARIAEWLGGSHLGYHGGLHTAEAIAALDPATVRALLRDIGRQHRVDCYLLTSQRTENDGLADPIVAALPAARSVNDGYELTLAPSFDGILERHSGKRKRKNARRKERMLAEAGDYRIEVLKPAAAVAALADLFAQKSRRLKAQGLHDVFGDPGIPAFYAAVAGTTQPGDDAAIEIWALRAGGGAQAYSAVSLRGGRVTGMLLSFADGDLARASPGEILIHRQIEAFVARGFETYDFGAGQERYKSSWADRTIPLVDTFLALTPLGHVQVAERRLRATLVGAIRRNAVWWERVRAFRRFKAKLGDDAEERD